MAHNYKMTRALNAARLFVSVDDVERGLACSCTCIDCGSRLVAKKGGFKAKNFAHSPDDAKAKMCNWSYETDLHIIAKEVIRKSKILSIPMGLNDYQNMVLNFDEVEEEKTLDESKRRPDITAYFNGETIHVEIAVSNPCDKEKVISLRKQNLNVLEVYLDDFVPSSDIITFDEVKKHIYQAYKKWLCICPSGYIGSLINEHERAYLRDLIEKRKTVEVQVAEIENKLEMAEGKLSEKLVTIEQNDYYLQTLQRKNDAFIEGLKRNNETYQQQLNQEIESLKEDLYWLNQGKSKLTREKEYNYEQQRTQALNDAQAQFNSEKDYLEQQFFAMLESDKAVIYESLTITKASLTQYEADLDRVKSEYESVSNSLKALKGEESLLAKQKVFIDLANQDLATRGRKYQTIAHNLSRITPDLRAITSRAGMPFPFDENIIDELEKPVNVQSES